MYLWCWFSQDAQPTEVEPAEHAEDAVEPAVETGSEAEKKDEVHRLGCMIIKYPDCVQTCIYI